MNNNPRPIAWLLLGLAMLVHGGSIAWVYYRSGKIDTYAFQSLDSAEYYQIARNIVQHGRFSQDSTPPLEPDTWRTPGYPIFLAAFIAVVGDSPAALILIQHLLAVAGVVLFYQIALKYLRPRRAGIATLLFLFEPYHLFYAFWLLSTTFFTFMLILTWWTWERACISATAWHYSLLGLLLGFLVLIWPGAIMVPFFALFFFLVPKPTPTSPNHHITTSPHRLIALLVVAISCLLPPATWMARNRLVVGHFALSHQSGIVLAYFKATEVELWRQGRTEDRYLETSTDPSRQNDPHTVWEGIDAELAATMNALCVNHLSGASGDPCRLEELKWSNLAQGNKTSHDSFELARVLSWIGLRIMAESPFSTLCCGSFRVIENLVFPLNLAIMPAKGAQVNRVKSAALGLAYGLLAVGAAMGALRGWKNWRAFYFPVACLVALALTTTPQIDPRFRVPLIPFLAFLALFPARRAESE